MAFVSLFGLFAFIIISSIAGLALSLAMASFADTASRWSAVVAREPSADGCFVYCVKTTKIYCRPTCKARLARRANVNFYATPLEAERAGYRSCKRCRPELAYYNPEADIIVPICQRLCRTPKCEPLPRLDQMAKEAGLSKHHFHRLFKKQTGLTPNDFAIAVRRLPSEQPGRFESTHYPSAQGSLDGLCRPESDIFRTMIPVSSLADARNSDDAAPAATGEIDNFKSVDHSTSDSAAVEIDTLGMVDECTSDSAPDLEKDILTSGLIPIFYSIRMTSYGLLLIAFKNGEICKLDLGATESEVVAGFEEMYPSWLYRYVPIDGHSGTGSDMVDRQITDIMDALERPSGKTLNLQLESSLFRAFPFT